MKTTYFYLLIIAFSLCTLTTKAQNIDSITFTSQQWHESIIRDGVVWKQTHFQNLYKSKQLINIIEIDLSKKNIKNLKLAALANSRKKTSQIADSLHALVAINGGFFDMKNGGATDYIKVDKKVINYSRNKYIRANAYLAFNTKKLIITSDSIQTSTYDNVILSGPYLVNEGENLKLNKNAFNDNRHPRTAIAIKNNKLILLTVDGRNANSEGLNLTELANLFRWYGCEQAMNLDGGGSTTMYIEGQPQHGIVNYPSDNKLFDHEGERAVSNIIYLQ